jgi:nucleoside permease NupC
MGFQVKSSGIFSGMRFAVVVAAFLIGLVTGIAALNQGENHGVTNKHPVNEDLARNFPLRRGVD